VTAHEVSVLRIRVDVPAEWQPPFVLDLPATFRRVDEQAALAHSRPHRIVAVGGSHDGYAEWWVSDGPCGCEH